eukprot:GHVT01038918.1.p1 GENE.GHVT01038918.1~~GHVT01038918.1.p1  ORF type:complete len:116 (-),score=2.43 GHVT01038918.1:460-807(-)
MGGVRRMLVQSCLAYETRSRARHVMTDSSHCMRDLRARFPRKVYTPPGDCQLLYFLQLDKSSTKESSIHLESIHQEKAMRPAFRRDEWRRLGSDGQEWSGKLLMRVRVTPSTTAC